METVYITLDEDGYIDNIKEVKTEFRGEDEAEEIEIEVEENHELFRKPYLYQYIDGEIVRDNEKAKPTIFFQLNENNYLLGVGSTRSSSDEIELVVEENSEVLRSPEIFKYIDGELIRCEKREQELIEEFEELENRLSPIEEVKELLDIILGGGNY